MTLNFEHYFSMPNHLTFNIKPINKILQKICWPLGERIIIDPFANRNHGFATYYNDINPDNYGTSLDALEFIGLYSTSSVDVVLFDPPYSLRQLKECYDSIGVSLTQEDSQTYFSRLKKEISRVLKPGGLCISFAWNTNGIGKNLGFEKLKIAIIHHGGVRNDTLVLVEKNMQRRLPL